MCRACVCVCYYRIGDRIGDRCHRDGDGDPRGGTHKDGDGDPRGAAHATGDGDPRGAAHAAGDGDLDPKRWFLVGTPKWGFRQVFGTNFSRLGSP